MKIITVYNNLKTDSESSGTSSSGKMPGWVFLPDSSLMKSGNPFFLPDLEGLFMNEVSKECVAYPSVVFRLSKLGKNIELRFADRYIGGIGLCVCFVAEDIRRNRAELGLPWTEAVAFDRSFLCGDIVTFENGMQSRRTIDAVMKRADGGCERVAWTTELLNHPVEEIISRISRMNTIKIGDFLVPALPVEGFRLHIGDSITVTSEGLPPLSVSIK